jgi:hypothetical protein
VAGLVFGSALCPVSKSGFDRCQRIVHGEETLDVSLPQQKAQLADYVDNDRARPAQEGS